MNKLHALIIFCSLIIISCAPAKETDSISHEQIKRAVETKRYIIKFDRIYGSNGSHFELLPRSNFIIIDGERAIISAAYVGSQRDIKRISGLNMRGISQDYQLTRKPSNGAYDIQLRMTNGNGTTFKMYITVNKSGYCDASVTSLKIDNIRYTGHLSPISSEEQQTPDEQGPDDRTM